MAYLFNTTDHSIMYVHFMDKRESIPASDVPLKLCYEWVKTGHWDIYGFHQWLKAKGINNDLTCDYLKRMPHSTGSTAMMEGIQTGVYNRRQFTEWVNFNFFGET